MLQWGWEKGERENEKVESDTRETKRKQCGIKHLMDALTHGENISVNNS